MQGSECVCCPEVKVNPPQLWTVSSLSDLQDFLLQVCALFLSSPLFSLLLNFKQAFAKHKILASSAEHMSHRPMPVLHFPLLYLHAAEKPCGFRIWIILQLHHAMKHPRIEIQAEKGPPNGRRTRSKRIRLALRVVFLRGHSRRCQPAADRRSSNPDRQSLAPIEGNYSRPRH